MAERIKGEKQELYEALGRVIRIREAHTGSAERPALQLTVTIPRAIATLMFSRTELWQWGINEEGIVLRPIDRDEPEYSLPTWADNGTTA